MAISTAHVRRVRHKRFEVEFFSFLSGGSRAIRGVLGGHAGPDRRLLRVEQRAMQYASSGGVTRTHGPQTMLALNDGFEVHSRVPRGLPALLTSGMNRQGARMGLTLWTPLAR